MNTVFIVLPILTLLMFELGLTVKLADFRLLAKDPKPVFIALFGQIVLLPIIAFILASIFHLTPLFYIGVILIACCPGGFFKRVFDVSKRERSTFHPFDSTEQHYHTVHHSLYHEYYCVVDR